LVDALTGHHLWAERYDRDLKYVFALQDEITMKILTAVQVKLTEGEQALIYSKGTENLQAYLKILKAREYVHLQSKEKNGLSRQVCDEVILLDPKYAAAYSVMASTHWIDVWYGYSEAPRKSMKQAFALAQKALSLKADEPGACTVLAMIYLTNRKFEKSIALQERTLRLNPNWARGTALLAMTLNFANRREEAIALFKKAIRLNPMPPNWYLHHLALAYLLAGQHEEVISLANKILLNNPDYLSAHLGLAAAYISLGRVEEARAAVSESLRINPNCSVAYWEKTLPFKDQSDRDLLMNAWRKAGLPETPPLPLLDKPSIAVLPFVNMSDDPKQEYFVDGMTDDLITDLSKISGLLVIARNSTFTYKGRHVKVQKVSQDLGARYVVEGTVRKAGNDIRINAQLIDATTGHHMWAQRYDGKLHNIFALQDEITGKIVSALAVKLAATEQKDKRPETENIEAYDAFLKGYEYYFRGTVDDAVMAISYFEKAIELDQNYGRAYAALAKTYFLGPKIGREWYVKTGFNYQKSVLRARHYLEMATKKPTSTSHQIASLMSLQRRQYKKAMAEAELALSLEPNGVESNFNMGYVLVFLGRVKEGIDYLKKSIELDPLRPGWAMFYMGVAHFSMGQFDKAVELINRALTYNPKTLVMSGILAAAYAHLGREKEARLTLQNYSRGFYYIRDLNGIMFEWPFKDPNVADRLAEGLIKAGLAGQAFDYCKVLKENKLTGEEIKKLLFGRNRKGLFYGSALTEWTVSCTKDGKFEHMTQSFYDTGKSWIEGDSVFFHYNTQFEGRKLGGEVHRNPDGTPEKMNEYFLICDWGIQPFSVEG